MRQLFDVTARVDESSQSPLDEFEPTADLVAQNHGEAAEHGFAHYSWTGIVLGREYEKIGRAVDRRKLFLVLKAQKMSPVRNTQLFRFRSKRAV